MPTKKIRTEFREASLKEVRYAIVENFFFGFSGAIIVPFIALRMDVAVLIGYMIHYFYISKGFLKSDNKFESSSGFFFIFFARVDFHSLRTTEKSSRES